MQTGKAIQYPLSRGQERLWFEDRYEPGMTTYNVPFCFRLDGPLNVEALQRGLQAVIGRHEVLRTVFRECGDQLVQVVQDYRPETFTAVDLGSLPEAERPGVALRAAMQEARTPFDLGLGPLVRFKLRRLAAGDHLLSVTFHHAVTDGWSTKLFFKELSANYQAYATGQEPAPAAAPIQYGEYAREERRPPQNGAMAHDMEFWRTYLGGPLSPLDLPGDRARPGVRRSAGAKFFSSVDSELLGKLRSVRARTGGTLFMLLLAAFKTLLYRYTGQEDILVGTPVAGRKTLRLFDTIGFFVNTIVLRTSLQGNPTFLELLQRVQGEVSKIKEHQHLPLEELVRLVQVQRDLSRTSLYQVMFVQDPSAERLRLPGMSVREIGMDNGGAICDLRLSVRESTNGAIAEFEYSTDLFDEATIGRMATHYTRLLEGIVDAPECPIRRLPILPEAERKQLLHQEKSKEADRSTPRCVHQLFERQAERQGAEMAVVSGTDQLTYDALNRRANRLAYRLRARGVTGDVLVGLCAERSPDLLVGVLATMKAGGAYVPLDPRYPHERLRFIVNDAQPKIILAQRQTAPVVAGLGIPVVCVEDDRDDLPDEADANPGCSISGENLAYVIYTSGSTGQPKGVLVSHRNLARLFTCTDRLFDFGPADTWTLFHSFAFDVSVWEMWGALLHGGKLVVVPYDVSRDPHLFYGLLVDQKVTVLCQTPSAFLPLVQYEESLDARPVSSLRYVIFAGEQLDVRMLAPWVRRHGCRLPRLINMYGPTEATVYVTYKALSQNDLNRTGIIGLPLDDLQVFVLDQELQPAPVGVPGEICISGEGLARGYLHRPEVEAKRFVANPYGSDGTSRLYRSGDRGRILANGELEFLGRFDDQVKIRGFRVEPAEIESRLLNVPGIATAKVVAQENLTGDKQLVAYCIAHSAGPIPAADLKRRLAVSLPDYMVPSRFVFIDHMPLTPGGKLDRSALPRPGQDTEDREQPYVQPRDAMERRIAAAWSDVLQMEPVGAFDNFFALGGDSLSAMRSILRLSQELGFQIPIRILFDHPLVSELAKAIRDFKPPEQD